MKRILVLLVAIICFVGVKAQVYYYVKAGADPNNEYASCCVIRAEQSGRLVWVNQFLSPKDIKSALLNDPQYYEKLKISNNNVWYGYGFKNSQSNMNIYMHTCVNVFNVKEYLYMALSYDYKNLIMNPEKGDNHRTYYKQVPKSTFEFKGMDF